MHYACSLTARESWWIAASLGLFMQVLEEREGISNRPYRNNRSQQQDSTSSSQYMPQDRPHNGSNRSGNNRKPSRCTYCTRKGHTQDICFLRQRAEKSSNLWQIRSRKSKIRHKLMLQLQLRIPPLLSRTALTTFTGDED